MIDDRLRLTPVVIPGLTGTTWGIVGPPRSESRPTQAQCKRRARQWLRLHRKRRHGRAGQRAPSVAALCGAFLLMAEVRFTFECVEYKP